MFDLDEVVVVNLNSRRESPGDVDIYRSVEEAGRDLEVYDVRSDDIWGYTFRGYPIVFSENGEQVDLRVDVNAEPRKDLVRAYILGKLSALNAVGKISDVREDEELAHIVQVILEMEKRT